MNEDNIVSRPAQVPGSQWQSETPQPLSSTPVINTVPGQTMKPGVFPQPQQSTALSDINNTSSVSDSVQASVEPVTSPYIPQNTPDTSLKSEAAVTASPLVATESRKSHKKLTIALILVVVLTAIIVGFIMYNGDKAQAPKTTDPSITKTDEDTTLIEASNKQAAEAAAKQTAVQDIDSSISTLDSAINESNDAVDFNTTSLSAATLGVD